MGCLPDDAVHAIAIPTENATIIERDVIHLNVPIKDTIAVERDCISEEDLIKSDPWIYDKNPMYSTAYPVDLQLSTNAKETKIVMKQRARHPR